MSQMSLHILGNKGERKAAEPIYFAPQSLSLTHIHNSGIRCPRLMVDVCMGLSWTFPDGSGACRLKSLWHRPVSALWMDAPEASRAQQ